MEQKKSFTILGVSIWRIIAYFIIYSVIGYVVETIYGILTMGIWECRQSFLYGPFCGIYGVGATLMIVGMKKIPKTPIWLFLGGFILGSVTEYTISYACEKFAGINWWDYSYLPYNLNGRIALRYSIFWGILAIFLVGYFNPLLGRGLESIKRKIQVPVLKGIVLSIFVFIVLDFIATAFAIQAFLVRMEIKYDLDIPNKQQAIELYDRIYSNEKVSEFIYKYLGDEKMITTFPNLKVEATNGEYIHMKELLPHIKPYYMKFVG